jgi:hypothetical protein
VKTSLDKLLDDLVKLLTERERDEVSRLIAVGAPHLRDSTDEWRARFDDERYEWGWTVGFLPEIVSSVMSERS